MSALLIDDAIATTPRQWVHVPREARRSPGGRPGGVAAPQVSAPRVAQPRPAVGTSAGEELPSVARGWQLTRRGLAVVVWGFLALMAVSAVVLVTGFFSVSNEPPATQLAALAQVG
jgi:hypothetical protein